MDEQPTALRLAKWLDAMPSSGYALPNQAATELRRLYEENQSLSKCLFQMQEAAKKLEQQLGEAVWNYGEKVRANQELLEVLKTAEAALSDIGDADREPEDDVAWCEARAAQALPKARAAIAKAQGETK